MFEDAPIPFKPWKVLAVRGPLTRKKILECGVDCPELYGDPALLLPYIYMPRLKEKKYEMGVIPHLSDMDNSNLFKLVNSCGGKCCIINFKNYESFESVIDTINSCECIISSSLHGLIISDAYNIPNLWVEFSDLVEGCGFKFRDYFLSVERDTQKAFEISNLTTYSELRKAVKKWQPIKYNPEPLLDSFPYKNILVHVEEC